MDTASVRNEIISLANQLVATNSVSGNEGPCAETLLNYFQDKSVESRMQEVEPGRYNLVARVPGMKPTLLFNGHTDMVDVVDGWTTNDPFKLETDGDWMLGAGMANMKGSLAAQAVATAIIAASNANHSEVIFTAVVGECSDLGLGTLRFLEKGGTADFAIVGEPTGMLAQTSHTGTYEARIDFNGLPVHIGDYVPGVNAVETASEFVLAVRDTSVLNQGSGLFAGSPRVMAGRMTGGFYPQIAAPSASVWVDIRIPIGTTQNELENYIDSIATKCCLTEHSSFKRTSLAYEPAYLMSESGTEFLKQIDYAFTDVTGKNLSTGFVIPSNRFFATDAAHLEAAGIPSIVLGPGVWMPGPDEKISIKEACEYAQVLILVAHKTTY
jgi:acetylornithine deacetylase